MAADPRHKNDQVSIVKRYVKLSDFRGLSRMAIDAARDMTDVVEHLHFAIAAPFGLFGTQTHPPTTGITGLVYRSIHTGYDLLGMALDALLDQIIPRLNEPASTSEPGIPNAGLGVLG